MSQSKKLRPWQKALRTITVLAFFVLVGFCCGLLMVAIMRQSEGTAAWMVFAVTIGSLYLSIFLHIAIHEFGHYLFGKLTGYRFTSYRLGSVMLLRQDGRLCLKRFTLAGTGGQCLMDPPEMVDGNFPYVLYNLGGVFVNLLLAVVAGLLLFIPGIPPVCRGFLVIFVSTGLFFGLVNGLPLPSSMVNNDGRNTLDIHRSPQARRSFWIQMRANVLTAAGVRTRDMPEEWFVMPTEVELQNPIIATMGVAVASRFLEEGKFAEAEEAQRYLLENENGMVEIHRRLLLCDRIFCALLDGRQEEVGLWLDKEQKQFMKSMATFPSVIRTQYAIALVHDQEPEAADKYKESFIKCEKNYPYPVECQTEREMMDRIDQKVAEMHKNA